MNKNVLMLGLTFGIAFSVSDACAQLIGLTSFAFDETGNLENVVVKNDESGDIVVTKDPETGNIIVSKTEYSGTYGYVYKDEYNSHGDLCAQSTSTVEGYKYYQTHTEYVYNEKGYITKAYSTNEMYNYPDGSVNEEWSTYNVERNYTNEYNEETKTLRQCSTGGGCNTIILDNYGNIVSKNGHEYTWANPQWKNKGVSYSFDTYGSNTQLNTPLKIYDNDGKLLVEVSTEGKDIGSNGLVVTQETVKIYDHTLGSNGMRTTMEAYDLKTGKMVSKVVRNSKGQLVTHDYEYGDDGTFLEVVDGKTVKATRHRWTIREANEATPDRYGKYNVEITW